jgi:capsular polysaccharide export protein
MAEKIALSSMKMGKIPHIGVFLGGETVNPWHIFHAQKTAGWGYSKASLRLKAIANHFKIPFFHVEDGFLRSVGLGKEGAPPHSLIIDDMGVYYDASTPCRLDELIKTAQKSDIREMFNALRLTKYNHERDVSPDFPKTTREIVLVIDQVYGDSSIKYAGATHQTFFDMVDKAKAMHPNALIYLKIHPDVVAGRARGILAGHKDLLPLITQVSPHALLDCVDHVHTVSSQFGFEAKLRGVPTSVYAKPFYTKTDDIDVLATAALALYPTYLDPVFGEIITPYCAMELLARRRDLSQSLCKTYSGYGFSSWKQGYVRDFLKSHGAKITFKAGENPLIWGKKADMPLASTMEDGFIRSRGLGSNLTAPLSLVIDNQGIYFDAIKPSDFEKLAADTVFTPELLTRAMNIRQIILDKSISKYNLISKPVTFEQPFRLVIGQVEDDASIKFGTMDISTNDALLSETRRKFPNDFVVYKQHPDVTAGNRKGALKHPENADFIVTEGDVTPLFAQALSVHTMSSLAGFEALMRDIPVYCEGLPFYAGYGLTHDRHKTDRRIRKLTMLQLIAVTLILYPRYADPKSKIPLEVEEALKIIQKSQNNSTVRTKTWLKNTILNNFK